MSYEKQTWVTGDTVTAEKLNHMENGIESATGLLHVNFTYDESSDSIVLDKTWEQIANSAFSIIAHSEGSIETPPLYIDYYAITNVGCAQSEGAGNIIYSVDFANSADHIEFKTDTPDGYPKAQN